MQVAKGVYFRLPAQRGTSATNPYLAEEESGTLFLTNKRLVYNGTRNISYSFNKIAHIEWVNSAIAILKENETIVKFFKFENEEVSSEFTDMLSFLLGKDIQRTLV